MCATVTRPRADIRVLHIGGYWRGPNDVVRQMMLGLQDAGYQVYEFNTDEHPDALDTDGKPYDRGTSGPVWLRQEVMLPVIRAFHPDIIVCNAGGLGFCSDFSAEIREQSRLIGIAHSDPDVFQLATRHIAPNFDLFLTNSPGCVTQYERFGVRVAALPVATSAHTFHPVPPKPEYANEVLILGRAHPDRVEPTKVLCERFHVHLYGEDWERYGLPSRGLALGEEALTALSSTKMTIVFNKTAAGHPIIKGQIFDFMATGALVVTNEWEGLSPYFEYGRHLVGFTSTPDLVEKVAYYLSNTAKADAIRQAGRAHVLTHHTWASVWPRILDRMLSGSTEIVESSS